MTGTWPSLLLYTFGKVLASSIQVQSPLVKNRYLAGTLGQEKPKNVLKIGKIRIIYDEIFYFECKLPEKEAFYGKLGTLNKKKPSIKTDKMMNSSKVWCFSLIYVKFFDKNFVLSQNRTNT